jgi:hypothetical protein
MKADRTPLSNWASTLLFGIHVLGFLSPQQSHDNKIDHPLRMVAIVVFENMVLAKHEHSEIGIAQGFVHLIGRDRKIVENLSSNALHT